MNLYRIDLSPDGRASYPLRGLMGDYLSRHYAGARADAIVAARETGDPATITRISGGGSMRAVAVAMPTGNVRRIENRRR